MKITHLKTVFSWRLIGPLAVVAAIVWAGPAKIWAVLSGARLPIVAGVMLLAVPLAIIKGIRWRLVLKAYHIDLPLGESTSMYAMGMTMAAVTPGHLGDFVKVFSLMDRGFGIGRSLASNVVDRLLDVAFVLLIGYGGMWYFSQYFSARMRIASLAFAALLVVLVVLAARLHMARKAAMRLVPARFRPTLRESWDQIVAGLWRHGYRRGALLLALTAGFWMIQFCAAYLCATALGLDVPFVYLSACLAIVTVASFVPITVAGAGTRDAILLLLLGQIGVTGQQSLALASLILATFVSNCVAFYLISLVSRSSARPAAGDSKALSPAEATADSSERCSNEAHV